VAQFEVKETGQQKGNEGSFVAFLSDVAGSFIRAMRLKMLVEERKPAVGVETRVEG